MELNLTEFLLNPEKLNAGTLPVLARLVSRYPYFQIARILYLRNLYQLHDRTFGEELKKTALYVDRQALFFFLEGNRLRSDLHDSECRKPVSFAEENMARADSLIDSFLSKRPEEKARKPRAVDVTTDYIAYMLLNEQEEDSGQTASPKMQHQELIDDFIDKSGGRFQLPKDDRDWQAGEESMDNSNGSEQTALEPVAEDEEFLTETLAKIYIKQGRYAKAIEIIRKLSLRNPKKNRYFADQIRFLEKLILNNKYK